MIKKTITYVDYNGVKRSEDYWFNLDDAELMRMNMSKEGGFQVYIQNIIDSKDNKEIYDTFESIVQMSIGHKSIDGRSFIKDDEFTKAFVQSPAYSELIVGFLNAPNAASEFVAGLLYRIKEIDTDDNTENQNVNIVTNIKNNNSNSNGTIPYPQNRNNNSNSNGTIPYPHNRNNKNHR
jgi:hypothetical protein